MSDEDLLADDPHQLRQEAEDRITAAMAIDPEDHATKSRDYGRGFADAIRLVREALARPFPSRPLHRRTPPPSVQANLARPDAGEAATAAGAPAGLGLRFIAHGLPKPKGSLRHVGRGRMIEQVNGATWHDTILWSVVQAMRTPDPLTGPLRVEATFTFPKPKSAPKTRRIWPITRATGDLDKQLRRLFDAMQAAGAFADDSQIVEVAAAKRYVNEGDAALTFPGVVVRITPLPPETTESG